MKVYQFEGKDYVESGEVRVPRIGEVFLSVDGFTIVRDCLGNHCQKKILTPKEEVKMDNEYQIPVLVKADADGPTWSEKMNPYRGQVILCRKRGPGYAGPKWGLEGSFPPAPEHQKEGWHFLDSQITIFPTQAQVEAEQEKLKPKADPLPSALDNFLNTPNGNVCEGARKWAREFATLIYANPPKAKE